MKEELIEQLEAVHDMTSQDRTTSLRERIGELNVYDPENRAIFELAKTKRI